MAKTTNRPEKGGYRGSDPSDLPMKNKSGNRTPARMPGSNGDAGGNVKGTRNGVQGSNV